MSKNMQKNKNRWAENGKKIDAARAEREKKELEELERKHKETVKSKKYLNLKETGLKFELHKGEKFKQCIDAPNLWISNYGRLIRKQKKRYKLLSPTADMSRIKSYYRVYINGKPEYVHRLVALVWCAGYSAISNEVHHLDGNGTNNYYKNLRWCCKMHHYFLDRGIKLYFLNTHKNSQMIEIVNLEEITQKMHIDLNYLSKVLRDEPDNELKNGLEIYYIDSSTDKDYIIMLERPQKEQAA